MKNIFRILKNEDGATSVLVIFMMIVLVTLGAFAITSARVNYRFSLKARDWNNSFYALDSQAENYVKSIDKALLSAEKIVIDYYAKSLGFLEDNHAGIPFDVQSRIFSDVNRALSGQGFAKLDLNEIYMLEASKAVHGLGYPHTVIEDDDGITVEINFSEDSEENANAVEIGSPNVYIKLKILPLNYDIYYASDVVTGEIIPGGRFEVLQWNQWQREAQNSGEYELWSGDLETH